MANLMNPAHYNLATMGQVGSVYHKYGGDPVVAPEGKVFVAITMVTNTKFESSGGLVAEDPAKCFGTSGKGSVTTGAAQLNDNLQFPAGVTIYGRWTQIDANAGDVIAYLA